MCGGGSPPKPIPPPEYADYAKKRKQLPRPTAGTSDTILTSPLGLTTPVASVQKATLLGR